MARSSSHISRVLDQCVQQIEQDGATLDDCLARYPAHRAELAHLLPLILDLHQAPKVTLSPASVRAGRRQLIAQLPPRPQAPRSSLSSLLPWRKGKSQTVLAKRSFAMSWIIVIATVVSLMAGGGLVYASDAAVPGDTLYGVDRAVEKVKLSLTRDPEAVFNLELDNAEERVQEMQALFSAGDTSKIKLAVDGYGDSLGSAVRQAMGADEAKGNAMRSQLENAAAEHEAMFKTMAGTEVGGVQDGVQIQDRDRDAYCAEDSEKLHPLADDLAEKYGVSEAQVNEWFCEGYGMGEIMFAINVALASGGSVADVLALLEGHGGGQGWGQILHDNNLVGKENPGPWHFDSGTGPGGSGQGSGEGKPEDAGGPGNEEPGNPDSGSGSGSGNPDSGSGNPDSGSGNPDSGSGNPDSGSGNSGSGSSGNSGSGSSGNSGSGSSGNSGSGSSGSSGSGSSGSSGNGSSGNN